MAYDLAAMAIRSRPWRVIEPTAALESDLAQLELTPVRLWQSAAASMMPAYAEALETGSVAELAQEEQSHAAEIAALLLLIQWRQYFSRLEAWQRRKWISSVSNSAGVDVSPLLERPTGAVVTANRGLRRATAATIRQAAREAVRVRAGVATPVAGLSGIDAVLGNAVAENASLVRSVSEQARARIANAVFNGVTNKTPVTEVAKQIAAGLALSRKRALSIAKDQVSKSNKAISRFRIEEAGFSSATWKHLAGQLHPRPTHRARNGSVLKLDDPRWAELSWPNCHCTYGPPPLLVKGRGNAAASRKP